MIMAFLLVVIVNGEPLENSGNWFFKSVLTCNRAANYIESGATSPKGGTGTQKGISAYCVPKSVPRNTKLWY
jgi:hypothetical protein